MFLFAPSYSFFPLPFRWPIQLNQEDHILVKYLVNSEGVISIQHQHGNYLNFNFICKKIMMMLELKSPVVEVVIIVSEETELCLNVSFVFFFFCINSLFITIIKLHFTLNANNRVQSI